MLKKRCLSLLMAFCMMLTFLPPPAVFAADVDMSASDSTEVESPAPDTGLEIIPLEASDESAPEADTGLVIIPEETPAPATEPEVEVLPAEAVSDADTGLKILPLEPSEVPGTEAGVALPSTEAPDAVPDTELEVAVLPTETPDESASDADTGLKILPLEPSETPETAPDTEAETVYQVTVPVAFADSDDETAALSSGEEEEVPFELPTELPGYVPEANLLAASKTYYYFRGLTYVYLRDIPVNYSGSTALGEGLFQVVDSGKNPLLSASANSYSVYDYSYNRYYLKGSYDSTTEQYNYTADVCYRWNDTSLLTEGNTYSMQLVIGNEIYSCDAEIVPVDGYYLYSAGLSYNLSTNSDTFTANLVLYGFRTEDDLSKLKLELLDGEGTSANVVATSTGNYAVRSAYYYPGSTRDYSYLSLDMELKLVDGAELTARQYYYLRVSTVGKPLFTNQTDLSRLRAYTPSTSTPMLTIEEAKLTQADPAKVRVKLGTVSQERLDEGYDIIVLASSSYLSFSSSKTLEANELDALLSAGSTYASARFTKGSLPADKVLTLSLHIPSRDSDSVYGMGSFAIQAFFVKENEDGTHDARNATSFDVRNPYYTSYDNTGSYTFSPGHILTTTTEIPFTITAYGWNSVYHTHEDNVVDIRDSDDNEKIYATCSNIEISYAQSSSNATLTGVFKNVSLESGSYGIHYNGKYIGTLNVTNHLTLLNQSSSSNYYGRYQSRYRFWTQFGEFHKIVEVVGGTGSGALVFLKGDEDALSSGTLQGTKLDGDVWSYEYTFTAEQLAALTPGEQYSLIFRDADGQSVTIFSSHLYDTETIVWPTRIFNIANLSRISSLPTFVGDDVIYAELRPWNFKNASLEMLQEALKKITLTFENQTLSVTEVGTPFFVENSAYVPLTLSAPLWAGNTYSQGSYYDSYYYTVHYGPRSEEDSTEDTDYFSVLSYRPSISTSRGLLNVFSASYFPADKTYTGKLYQGTTCLTPNAFPMTLTGAYGSGQVLSYDQSVLDALNLPEGNDYTLVVFMDDVLVTSLTFSVYYDEILPTIQLYGHYSYTDGVSEENLETWEGAYYTNYYYGSSNYMVIADQTGKYQLTAYNYGDFRYFRFADSLDALADAEFQSVGKGYFEGVLSDKTTRGWRTIYAEFSKKGVPGDSSNYTASNTIYVASDGDFGLTVPEEVGGLHENNRTYTITAALDTPNGVVWIGFHDHNDHVAYGYTSYSTFRDGKYYYSYSFTPSASASSSYYSLYDENYTGGDGSHYFRYIDTQSIEIFATDNTYVYHDGASYRGNIASETVTRELIFGAVDTIYLRNGRNGGNQNTRTYTISGYALADDAITITEGETTVATTTANEYGYFTVELTNIADGDHTYSVTGKNTEKGATTSISVDATPPVITAFTYAFLPDGRNMVLRWYCDDEDVSSFTLYKNDEVLASSINPTARIMNVLTEPNNTFSMLAVDKYGNESTRVEQVFTDEADPVAVVTPETIQVGRGIETVFEGGMSSDDFGIASYSWDFGDGSSKALTRRASHIFSQLGDYTVTLTVTDYAGKTSTATSAVTVVDAGDPTTFIVHDQNDKAMAGVVLSVTAPDGTTARYTSNSKGEATLYLPNGLYNVTAVAAGYQVRSFSFEITDKRHKFTLYMNTEDILKVETEVTEMTLEEIEAAHIDTTAPENQHVYNCVATFEFGKIEYICNDKEVIQSEPLKAGNITAYVVEKDIYLIVYSRVNWLKEMFKVELRVGNTSDYEVVEECAAALTVPKGLSLAKMTADVGAQSETVKLGMIEKGHEGVTDWYLAGDEAGEYELSGTVTGIRVGGGIKEDISINFTTSDKIQVQAGNAMHLDITAERYAIIGEPYHVTYKLENVSDKELYNVSLNVLGGQFLTAYSVDELEYDPENGPELTGEYTEDGKEIASYVLPVETFKPGDTINGVFTIKFGEGLDIANADGMTYALKDMFVATGAGSTTTIPTDLHVTDNYAFLLSFEGNGSDGSMAGLITAKAAEGDETEITLPENTFPAPEGQRPAGWELDGQTYKIGDTVKIRHDSIKSGVITLKALWEDIIYTVTYDADGGTGDEMDAATFKYNETFTLPECPFTAPQYKKFKAWQIGETEYAPGEEITITDDATVKAVWEDITYTVTYDANGGTGDEMEAATATAGVPFKLPACPFTAPEFQRFKAWQIGEEEVDAEAEYTFTADTTVTALWEDITYAVTYDHGTGTGDMKAGTATAGKAFTLPECTFTAPESQRFKAWQIGREQFQPEDEYTFTADTTVTALWEDITYTVTYDPGDGTGEMAPAVATINKPFTLPASTFTAPAFQKFKAWQIGEEEVASGTGYTFTADTTVTALWEDITYTVTYEANGGSETMEAGTATAGKAFTLPECTFTAPEFQQFKAWQIGREEFHPGDQFTFTANTTVRAIWENITYTVTYAPGDGTGEMAPATATAGKAFRLPARADFTAPNFQKLKAWKIGEEEYEPNTDYTFTADTTVTAIWEDITYTVTYSASGAEGEMEAGTATAGKAFTLPENGFTVPEFKYFKAWQIGREQFQPGEEYTFTANTTVSAVWADITYTLTYEPGEGTGEMAPATATAGKAFTLPTRTTFTAPEFQQLKAWEIVGEEYAPGAEYTFISDTTVTAIWEDITYTVTYGANNGGGAMEAGTATAGKAFTLPENGFTAPELFRFKAWQIGREQFQPGDQFTFTANTTVTAVWENITYTVTYDANGGAGTMAPGTATAGRSFKLPAGTDFTAPDSKRFKAWEIGGVEYAPGTDYTFTADTTVKTLWETITYTVTYSPNGGTGTMAPQTVLIGQPFKLPAKADFTPPEFQQFKAWRIGNTEYEPEAELNLTADTTVQAVWKDITLVITYAPNGGLGVMPTDVASAGKPFKLPTVGYGAPEFMQFKAWYFDGKEYAAGESVVFTENATVRALWEDQTFTVTFAANGGSGTMDKATAVIFQPFTLPENGFSAPSTYKFKAWRIGRDEYAPGVQYTFTADTTVSAVWQKVSSMDTTVKVSFNTGGGTSVQARVIEFNTPVAQPEEIPYKTGYTFSKWLLNGKEFDFESSVMGDTVLTAEWIPDKCVIRFVAEDGTELSSTEYDYGTEASKIRQPSAPAKAPTEEQTFTFAGWSPEVSDVAGDATYTATYTAQEIEVVRHTVTFEAGNGTEAMTEAVKDGEAVQEPAAPSREGFNFVWWTLNGSRYDFSTPVTADLTLTAQWEEIPSYTVDFESNGGTDVSSLSVYAGSTAAKPTDPVKEGFRFTAWYRDPDLTQLYDFNAPVRANLTLYAKWTEPTKEGCYVATAVYGSYDCPEVWTLRRFRDNVLAKTWYGRLFIRLYYAVSPTAVRLFGDCAWFQNFFRDRLDRMVAGLQSDGFASTPYQDLDW